MSPSHLVGRFLLEKSFPVSFLALAVAFLAGCGSSSGVEEKRAADVVLEWGGEPSNISIGQSVYAEGLIAAHNGEQYALFIKFGDGEYETWRCALLSDLSRADLMSLPSTTPELDRDRQMWVYGKIDGLGVPFGHARGREGTSLCEVRISVAAIESMPR